MITETKRTGRHMMVGSIGLILLGSENYIFRRRDMNALFQALVRPECKL